MAQNIEKLFKLTQPKPPVGGLRGLILARIEEEKLSAQKRRLWLFGFVDLLSVVGLVFSGFSLVQLLASSGFFSYLSLVWSEGGSLNLFWKELLLSLTESLPIVSLTIFLAIALAFVASSAKAWGNIKQIYYQPS